MDLLTLLHLKKAVDHINRYLCVSENSSSCIPFSEITQQSTRQVLSVKYDLFRKIHVIHTHWGYSYVGLLGRTFFNGGQKTEQSLNSPEHRAHLTHFVISRHDLHCEWKLVSALNFCFTARVLNSEKPIHVWKLQSSSSSQYADHLIRHMLKSLLLTSTPSKSCIKETLTVLI